MNLKRDKKIFISVVMLIFVLEVACLATYASASKRNGDISVFVSGDAIISQPWSHCSEPEFIEVINEIRNADIAVTNLEMLIHTYQGYPQAKSGGTWMAAEPSIVHQLVWAGIDMVAMANNHTYDYGSIGVIETITNLQDAGIAYAGAGRDLQHARSPGYFQNKAGTVALVSTSSTFVPFGKAGRSRPDHQGRPGLNPLTVSFKFLVPREFVKEVQRAARKSGIPFVASKKGEFSFLGNTYIIGEEFSWSFLVDNEDHNENLEAIRQAAKNADWVIVSVHAHQSIPGSRYTVPPFLRDFAHASVDNGADIFFSHGPHHIRGIEIYKGKPIFYGLGNFVFQYEMINKQPAEFYAPYGLGDDAVPDDVYSTHTENGSLGMHTNPIFWESVIATVEFKDGELSMVRLIPITLGFGEPKGVRGRPLRADADLSSKIIEKLARLSKSFGVEITFENNIGVIRRQTIEVR